MKRRALLLAALPLQAQAALSFPADFGAHPATGIEWWYLTGLLGDRDGAPPRYGYQLTFFRVPGPAAADHPSGLAAKQLLLGHVALSDLGAKQQRHAQRLLRTLPGAVQALEGDCDVRLRDWTLRRERDGLRAVFGGPGFALELELASPDAPLLQGEAGLSRKGPKPEQFSYYYSRPQLLTQASLLLDGRRHTLAGRAWLDHEWSDNVLGDAVGWDWLGINLDDGRALTLFQLRRKDGTRSDQRSWAGGSLRTPGQADRSFTPQEVDMQPIRHWVSPATGTRWPVEWRLKSPAGEMLLSAAFDAQEIDARRSSGLVYWEGAARLFTPEKRPLGTGYLELTGYAGRPPLL